MWWTGFLLLIPGALSFCSPTPTRWQHLITFTRQHAAQGVAELLKNRQHKGCILTSDEHVDQKQLVKHVSLYLRTHSRLSDAMRWEPFVAHLTNLDNEFGPSLDQVSDTARECPDLLVFADFGDRDHDWMAPTVLPEFRYHIHIHGNEPKNVVVNYRPPQDM